MRYYLTERLEGSIFVVANELPYHYANGPFRPGAAHFDPASAVMSSSRCPAVGACALGVGTRRRVAMAGRL